MADEGALVLARQLASADPEAAGQAKQVLFDRGTAALPALLALKGDARPYRGGGLGHRDSAFLIPVGTVNVELASLYLISAIYYGDMEFAESPFLVDLRLPREDRKAQADAEIIERAWSAVEAWEMDAANRGVTELRARRPPLEAAGLAFW